MMVRRIDVYNDGNIKDVEETVISNIQLWRVPHDIERFNVDLKNFNYITSTSTKGIVRRSVIEDGKSLPEVYRILPLDNVVLTEPLQKLWKDINPEISGSKWATLLGYKLAWCNGTGFGDSNDPRADYVNRQRLNEPPPSFDQVRCTGGAILRGTEVGDNVYIETILASNPPPTLTVLNSPWLWYWGTSVAPNGNIYYINRIGLDGTYKHVRVPIITDVPVYIPSTELHKLPIGFMPQPTWTHYD